MFKKGKLKSIMTFLLVLTMSVGMFSISAQAAGITPAEKTAVNLADDTYEVKIQVPGKDGDNRHDEVILMVDGSYSLDNEWPAMKKAINTIGETVLNGSGTTQLTLMAFGMGDNEVLVHAKTADELATVLGELPGNLLYGRSSTNCEAGFNGVARYIENHDETLRDVHVIYISDGSINTDEHLDVFDVPSQNWMESENEAQIVARVKRALLTWADNKGNSYNSCDYIINNKAVPSPAFTEVFGNTTAAEVKQMGLDNEISNETYLAWADAVYTNVYAFTGLTRGAEYPVSVVERAFVYYDKTNGTRVQDLFYSYLNGRSYPNQKSRTPIAADALAAMNEVKSMYVVDYDKLSNSTWMKEGITSTKSTFIQSNGIAGLCDALKDALTTLAKTPFNDVVVTDYMSKWVNVDTTSLRIVDNKTNQVIWNAAEGWKITDNRPTAKETPVIVNLVPAEEYAAGGSDVIGNTSGDIYKFTWYVKDGAMLRADSYALVYNVTVDTEEAGFVYEQSYPANGNTIMEYKDENGQDQKEDIQVPLVSAIERIINITKLTEIKNADGTTSTYPLEGIEFDIYYVCTVDEYTANIQNLETPSMDIVAGKTPVETLKTGVNGLAIYNLTEDGQPDGIYMIVEKDHPAVIKPLAPFYVAVPMTNEDGSGLIYEIDLEPKNDLYIPAINKDVIETENDRASVEAGEAFTWIVRTNIPKDIADAKSYKITDTIDYRLTYEGNVVVKVEEKAAPADNSDVTTDADDAVTDEAVTNVLKLNADYTVEINNGELELGTTKLDVILTEEGMEKVAKLAEDAENTMELRLYFDTIVDEDAKVGEEIPNHATLIYTNSVNFEFEVKSDEPKVYTCGINIHKYDAKDDAVALAGAEFMVARKATDAEIADESIVTQNLVIAKGEHEVVVFVDFYENAALTGKKVDKIVTNATGDAFVYGLEEGTYYLVETKAPAGYNLLSYPVSITLNQVSHSADYTVKVANSNSFVLPGTGGIGTTVFTMLGAALTLGSGAVLVGKKRKEEE